MILRRFLGIYLPFIFVFVLNLIRQEAGDEASTSFFVIIAGR